jgi:acetyl esterase/lipase
LIPRVRALYDHQPQERMMMKALCASLSACLVFSPTFAMAASCDARIMTGMYRQFDAIQYGARPATDLLNLFTPTTAQLSSLGLKQAGAALVIHGHGAAYNDPEFTTVCQHLAMNGIACASIEFPAPDGLKVFVWDTYASVNCATRWLRAHAGKFGYNAGRIGLYGVSFGGLQAMWQVATQGMSATPHLHRSVIEPDCPDAATADGSYATVTQYGQSDLTLPGPPDANDMLLGAHAGDLEYQTEFSPITYLRRLTPQLVSVGDYDNAVNPKNTGEWVRRLISLGARDIFVNPADRSLCPIGSICGGAFVGLSQYWDLGGFGHGYQIFGTSPNPPNRLVTPESYSCAVVSFYWKALLAPTRLATGMAPSSAALGAARP